LIDVKSNWLGRSKLKLAHVLDALVEINADGLGLHCHLGIRREMVKAALETDTFRPLFCHDIEYLAGELLGHPISVRSRHAF
jgi:hypothetical protein